MLLWSAILKNKQSIDFTLIKRVLIAKLRHHGDVLLSSPVFSILKEYYPHLEIDAYIYQETLPMLEGHPAISKFLLYDKSWKKLPKYCRFLREWGILRAIRGSSYDLVINLTEGDRGALAAKISGASYAIGFDPQGTGMFQKKKCYTHVVKHISKPRHTVEKQLDVLRHLGIFPKEEERNLFFHIPEEARLRVNDLLREKGVESGQFIHVHPVSRWMFKTLPLKTLVEVLFTLHKQGKQVVLTASPDPVECEMNQKITSLAPFVINFSGIISLKELGAMIEKSLMLLSVDSVPVHIASALKKPTLAIFGPTCEKNWGPWRNPLSKVLAQNICCRPCYQPGCGGSGRSECLATLSSERIIEEVKGLLKSEVLSEISSSCTFVFK